MGPPLVILHTPLWVERRGRGLVVGYGGPEVQFPPFPIDLSNAKTSKNGHSFLLPFLFCSPFFGGMGGEGLYFKKRK